MVHLWVLNVIFLLLFLVYQYFPLFLGPGTSIFPWQFIVREPTPFESDCAWLVYSMLDLFPGECELAMPFNSAIKHLDHMKFTMSGRNIHVIENRQNNRTF